MAVKLGKEESQKRLVKLKKDAESVIELRGLGGQKAYVALVLDISMSMSELYRNHVIQDLCSRLLGLAMNFDDNGAADVFLFGQHAHDIGEISQNNFHDFVDTEITSKFRLEPATHYAGVIQKVLNKYIPSAKIPVTASSRSAAPAKKGLFSRIFGGNDTQASMPPESPLLSSTTQLEYPVYVLFVTDGDNADRAQAEKAISEASKHGVFWQFIGIGNSSFPFLEKLDEMEGRLIDNANFFPVNDLEKISDEELYDRLLGEFPSWIPQSKKHGFIR